MVLLRAVGDSPPPILVACKLMAMIGRGGFCTPELSLSYVATKKNIHYDDPESKTSISRYLPKKKQNKTKQQQKKQKTKNKSGLKNIPRFIDQFLLDLY